MVGEGITAFASRPLAGTPVCPKLFAPQEYSFPSSAVAKEWYAPHAIWAMGGSATGAGVRAVMRERGRRRPSWDCSGVPHEKTCPAVSRARMWLFPAARETILVRDGMGIGLRWNFFSGFFDFAEAVVKPRMPSLAYDY